MDIVVNEWLPEYFRPNATEDEKKCLAIFLNRFMKRGDRIFVRRPSPFLDKINHYSKTYETQPEVVNPIRNFIKFILLDSQRCVWVDDSDFSGLPDNVVKLLSVGNYSSDKYLFESASAVGSNKLIVTSDMKLRNQFSREKWCEVILLQDFLADKRFMEQV